MRALIIGPPRSGKSLFAERILCRSDKGIGYVATLPLLPRFAKRIRSHKIRRPARWSLLEMATAWRIGRHQLYEFAQRNECIFLDGLSILLWSCASHTEATTDDFFACISRDLIDILGQRNLDWIIVDSSAPMGSRLGCEWFEALALRLQGSIEDRFRPWRVDFCSQAAKP